MTAIVLVTTSATTTNTATSMMNSNHPVTSTPPTLPPPPSPSTTSATKIPTSRRIIDTISITPKQPTFHHDIYLSLTSPALVKKKTSSVENGSALLSPTSLQLLRNSLTTTTNTTIYNNNYNHNYNNDSNSDDSTRRYTATNTSNTAIVSSYRKLKRLETEPIVTTKTRSTAPNNCDNNNNNNNNSSSYDQDYSTPTKIISISSTPQQTTHESTCSSSYRRRQIFGTYWDTAATGSHPQPQQSNQNNSLDRRRRSNSCCADIVPEPKQITTKTNNSKFPPSPQPIHTRSKSEGYRYHNNNNRWNGSGQSIMQYHKIHIYDDAVSTPTLPSPMQRLRKSSGGVYPLIQPKSILRRHRLAQPNQQQQQPVVSSLSLEEKEDSTEDDSKNEISHTDFDRASSISSNSITSTVNDVPTTSTSATLGARKPCVHFEPRVTITELAERDHERIWYSDTDLNRFKNETVATAKAYLMDHPDMVVLYSQPTYDPITKSMRKRALFSMPALADITITEDDDCSANNFQRNVASSSSQSLHECALPQRILSLLAFEDDIDTTNNVSSKQPTQNTFNAATIRRVLIVDHNRWVLDLFVRSVRTMFDMDYHIKKKKGSTNSNSSDSNDDSTELEIQCAPNALAALSIMTSATATHQPPFDLIISEQPLLLSRLHQQTPCTDTTTSPIEEEQKQSFETSSSTNGTDLLFHNIVPEYRNQMLLISVVAMSTSSLSLSNQQLLRNHTLSDFVWGKPPPRMDMHLRAQLIRALQKKREQYHKSKK